MYTATKVILQGLAVGLFASWVKSIVEPPLQREGEKIFPPETDQLKLKGADVTGQPENMPPAILAREVYNRFADKELSKSDTLKSMKMIHYALGTVIGVVYVAISSRNRKNIAGQGLLSGAAVWAATHGSIVPALGLQGPVSKMPKSWWVWEFGSHLVFGVAMEQSRLLLNNLLDRKWGKKICR